MKVPKIEHINLPSKDKDKKVSRFEFEHLTKEQIIEMYGDYLSKEEIIKLLDFGE